MNTLGIVVVAFVIGAVLSWFADRIFVRRSGYRDGFRPHRPLSSKVLSAVIGGIVLGVIGAIIGTLTVGRGVPEPAIAPPAAGTPVIGPAGGSGAPAAAVSRAPEPREWQPARTVDDGRTNVRQGPTTQDRRVTMLLPAQDVEVKPGAQWSQVRLPGKSQPLGYVRNDRIQRQR
jgi:hypothetical protein